MTLRSRPGPGPSRILVVCTGNLCRSPMAERMLTAALGRDDVLVGSAGTRAHAGDPMAPRAAAELARRGVNGQDFRARPLTAELVEDAALVLTAERAHRAAVLTLVPKAAARTFTLAELARLVDREPVTGVLDPTGLAELARSRRGRVAAARPEDDDLDDPYGSSRLAYSRCASRLDRLLAPVLYQLGAGRPGELTRRASDGAVDPPASG